VQTEKAPSGTKPARPSEEAKPRLTDKAPQKKPIDRNVIHPAEVTPEPKFATVPKPEGQPGPLVPSAPAIIAKADPPPDLVNAGSRGVTREAPVDHATSSPPPTNPVASLAQGQDQKAEIQKRLSSQFVLTQPMKDKSDIATAGAVLVLHKNNLLMYATSNPIPPQSAYKKGKITRNAFGRGFLSDLGNSMATPGASAAIVQRTFVNGEKLWVTNVDVKDDGVVLRLLSDPVDGIRYFGELKIPFPKGQPQSASDVMNIIAEVLTVESSDSSVAGDKASKPPGPLAIPPPASPQGTIALGQTKEQVVAIFGQPQKVATVGAKEIDYYPDMKVTFVNGKVTDVE
jgi:hypothetical protein